MQIYKEVQKLEEENFRLKKENENLKEKLSKANDNLRTLGILNRTLKHEISNLKN